MGIRGWSQFMVKRTKRDGEQGGCHPKPKLRGPLAPIDGILNLIAIQAFPDSDLPLYYYKDKRCGDTMADKIKKNRH